MYSLSSQTAAAKSHRERLQLFDDHLHRVYVKEGCVEERNNTQIENTHKRNIEEQRLRERILSEANPGSSQAGPKGKLLLRGYGIANMGSVGYSPRRAIFP